MIKDRYFAHRSRGPIYHDFLGSYHPGEKRVFFSISEKEKASYRAEGEYRRWSEAVTSIMKSWDEIPRAEKIKRGDLILYRHEGGIPNIQCSYFPSIPIFDITAYPDKVHTINKNRGGGIFSVTVVETRFTSLRDPLETMHAFGDDTKKSFREMRKVGYLRDEEMEIKASDFRLFDDINKFLTENFKIQLPKMRQEMEPFRPQ